MSKITGFYSCFPTTVESCYQAHIVIYCTPLIRRMLSAWQNSSRPSIKKRTALIKREANMSWSKHTRVMRTRITLQITNGDHFCKSTIQKCVGNVKRTKNIRHGTASHRICWIIRHLPSSTRSSTASFRSLTAPHFLVYMMATNYTFFDCFSFHP